MEPAIGVAVLAALVWGGYIYLLKRSFARYPHAWLLVVFYIFAVLWYLPAVAVEADRVVESAAAFGLPELGILVWTAFTTVAALLLFLKALAAGEVSYVTPINKIVPVFVLPIEILLLGQVLTPLQVLGVVVATFAVYVANYDSAGLFRPIAKAANSRPAQLALLSAVCFAVGDVGRRVALQDLAIAERLWVPLFFGTMTVMLLPMAVTQRPSLSRQEIPKFVAVGALVALGEHLTTLSFGALPASIASPIINTQAIVAVVLGGILLGERHFRLRLLAAVLAVVGVALLSL
jgi:drug/metabolite transporter (DMT)-like permease